MSVAIATLVEELTRLGVAQGSSIMVHASLRALGPIEGGAEGVIAALDAAVGPTGTTMMVLGARDEWAWVNERPEHERFALLRDAEPFDARTTPAEPEVGALAEQFRTAPGTRISDHPEGRFAARGALAEALTTAPPWDDYYGPGSALERLTLCHGRVLRLGADIDTVTLLHYAEYLAELPAKRRVRRHRRVHHEGELVVRTIDCLDDCYGVVDHPGEDYFAVILRSYLAEGRARAGRVACARAELLDAVDLVNYATAWMEQHLRP